MALGEQTMTSPEDTKPATGEVAQFLQQVRNASPSIPIDTDPESRRSHSKDRWPEAGKWSRSEQERHLPAAVVRPSTVDEVSAVLRSASAAGISVVPFGAGSGVVGGVVNDGVFVSLDLGGLAGSPVFDDERGEVTAGAGMLAAELEAALNARGRRIPHYPQSLGLASVGGLVATRSSGTFSSKYGSIEDLLVALEVVLADGTVLRTRAVPRSSTGPALAQLFVGSEGTLGVITAVTLRTFPLAESTRFRGIAFDELADGLAAVRTILDAGIRPAVIRLYDAEEAAHLYERCGVQGEGRALLILGYDGNQAVVIAEVTTSLAITAAHRGVDLGAGPGDTWSVPVLMPAGWTAGTRGRPRLPMQLTFPLPGPRCTACTGRCLQQCTRTWTAPTPIIPTFTQTVGQYTSSFSLREWTGKTCSTSIGRPGMLPCVPSLRLAAQSATITA